MAKYLVLTQVGEDQAGQKCIIHTDFFIGARDIKEEGGSCTVVSIGTAETVDVKQSVDTIAKMLMVEDEVAFPDEQEA